MAKKKKDSEEQPLDENVEDVVLAESVGEDAQEESEVQQDETPVDEQLENLVEPVKEEKDREIVFLAPYGQPRLAKTGKFLYQDGLHSVFETDDKKLWAIPYENKHASLKNGDTFTF